MRRVAVAAPPWITSVEAGRVTDLADDVEARLDLLDEPTSYVLIHWNLMGGSGGPGPLLTLRGRLEGGGFDGTPAEAAERLLTEVDAGATEVDAERDVLPFLLEGLSARGGGGVFVLASKHGTQALDLPRDGVTAWKVARPVTDGASMTSALEEARALAAGFAAGRNPRAFVAPYGPLGRGLRVVTAAIAEGAGVDAFVYGAVGPHPAGFAPVGPLADLPPLAELVDDLRLGEISGNARLFGLVGRPPARSPSPRLHNSVFRALGLDAVYLPEADLDAEAALALPYDGWSVTTPLKTSVAALCDELDPIARRVGAVNTVVKDPAGRLLGWNTDAEAVLAFALETGIESGGAAVLGGGGFARAVAVVLSAAGLSVRLFGRESARRTAAELGLPFGGEAPARGFKDRVLVNATPLGADGVMTAPLAGLAANLRPGVLALDAPYGADGAVGAFAAAARAAGCACADGYDLLLAQAYGQARLFTGKEVDPAVFRAALSPRGNLVLAGPRGAGKTSVGRLVARRLGRPFVDVDDEIARRQGRPAGRGMEEWSLSVFRDLEGREVARALARTGAVVALGGGALEAEGAVDRARARGFVVRLAVSPAEAARRIEGDRTPRPRLTDEPTLVAECERILREREPRYGAAAHATVATDGRALDAVAADVIDRWTRSDFGRRA